MNDLIARLESATEGSRGLDREIALSVGTYCPPDRGDPVGTWPHYTTSLDAALTLVPGGLRYGIQVALGQAFVGIKNGSILDPETEEWRGHAKTAPLALCIAALKAINASKVS